jgi:hypothetical protein
VRRFARASTTRLMRAPARMRARYDRAKKTLIANVRANPAEFTEAKIVGINVYLYGRASPVVFNDPSGLDDERYDQASAADPSDLVSDPASAYGGSSNAAGREPLNVRLLESYEQGAPWDEVPWSGDDQLGEGGAGVSPQSGVESSGPTGDRYGRGNDAAASLVFLPLIVWTAANGSLFAATAGDEGEALLGSFSVLPGAFRLGSKLSVAEDAATITVSGAAQFPRSAPFAKNASGPRTIDEAVELAKQQGIEIGDDVAFYAKGDVPAGADAVYLSPRQAAAGEVFTWESLQNRFGQVPVRVRAEVLESDEQIVAVFAHEMHEINSLRRLFEEGGSMTGGQLGRLINQGIKGNLHDQAWDAADAAVRRLRGGR